SRSPRLLVELTLMQLCSLLFNRREGEKKKRRLKPFRARPASANTVEKQARPEPAPVRKPATEPGTTIITSQPAASPRPAMVGKEERKKIIRSTGDNVSIRGIMDRHSSGSGEAAAATAEIAAETGLTGPVDMEKFEAAWNEFAESVREVNRGLHVMLTHEAHRLEDNGTIVISLANQVQSMDIQNVRGELLSLISQRTGVKGFTLDFEFGLRQDQPVRAAFMSPKEKYEAMAEKNPQINELRKRFNLQIDF
ncbi:MAG: hypothetical protein RL220_983, partial [Bacteroidota bacterium]